MDGEYTIMDGPMAIGNNLKPILLVTSNEGKGMHIMCIDRCIENGTLETRPLGTENEGGNSADDDVGVSVL